MNDNIKTQKPPFWIKEVNTQELFSNYHAENAYVHQILNNYQIGYFNEEAISYIQIARNLADIDDVEFYSNLNITFDPSYEEIILHHFKVFRNGTWVDKLCDAKINILQREEELSKLVYDGRQTLSLIFYDIRTGDLFDYSYSRKGKNPAFENFFGQFEYINSRSDVYMSHILAAFDTQNHKALEIRYFNQEEKLKKVSHDTYTSYELTTQNLKALKVPDDAPKWYDPWSRILFSNTATWKEINHWARNIYSDIYNADEEIVKLIEECKHYSEHQNQQITHALLYVQEQIRYFADGSNLGGIVPIDPNKSLKMRFADCKNKVVILKTILDGLGVESYPVLVSTSDGEMLPHYGPNITAFNHMIIQVIHNNKKYWFDATSTGQAGDLEHISQANYGYALVLNENEDELQSMRPMEDKASIHTKQSYDLKNENAILEVTTTYTDFHADRMRKQVKGRQIYELQDHHMQYYEKKYPDIELRQPHEVIDDTSLNKLSIKEHYTLGNAWEYDKDEEEFVSVFECDELRSAYKIPEKNKRTAPFAMTYPSKVTEEREIFFPYTYEDETSTKKEDNPFFYYEKEENINKDENKLMQKYTYYAKSPFIEVKDIPQYIKDTENIYTNYRIWHHDPYDKSGLKITQSLPHQEHTIYIHAKQFYDLRKKEAKLSVKTDYYEHEAYAIRMKINSGNLEKLQQEYTDYYEKRYEHIKLLKPFEFHDDKAQNKLTLIEEYSLGETWVYDKESKGYPMYFFNDIIGDAFNIPEDNTQKTLYELKYPSYVVEEREIAFPFLYETFLSNKVEENDFFSYEKKEHMDKENNTLIQKYIYKTKAKSVTPDMIKKYSKKADKIETLYVAWEKNDPYGKREIMSSAKSWFIFAGIFLLIRVLLEIFE